MGNQTTVASEEFNAALMLRSQFKTNRQAKKYQTYEDTMVKINQLLNGKEATVTKSEMEKLQEFYTKYGTKDQKAAMRAMQREMASSLGLHLDETKGVLAHTAQTAEEATRASQIKVPKSETAAEFRARTGYKFTGEKSGVVKLDEQLAEARKTGAWREHSILGGGGASAAEEFQKKYGKTWEQYKAEIDQGVKDIQQKPTSWKDHSILGGGGTSAAEEFQKKYGKTWEQYKAEIDQGVKDIERDMRIAKDEKRISTLEEKMHKLIEILKSTRETKAKEIAELKARIAELEKGGMKNADEIRKLAEQLAEKEKAVQALETKMSKVVGILKNQRERIAANTKEIENLKNQMAKMKTVGNKRVLCAALLASVGTLLLSKLFDGIKDKNNKEGTETIPVLPQIDSTDVAPSDTTGFAPSDSTRVTPADSTRVVPSDSTRVAPADSTAMQPGVTDIPEIEGAQESQGIGDGTINVAKNDGLTQSICKQLGLTKDDVKQVRLRTWEAVAELFKEQQARKPFYKGGDDITGDFHKNFVIYPAQSIKFDEDIWEKIVALIKADIN